MKTELLTTTTKKKEDHGILSLSPSLSLARALCIPQFICGRSSRTFKKSFEMLSNQRRIMRKKQNKKEKKINFLIQKYLHDLVYLLYLNLY